MRSASRPAIAHIPCEACSAANLALWTSCPMAGPLSPQALVSAVHQEVLGLGLGLDQEVQGWG